MTPGCEFGILTFQDETIIPPSPCVSSRGRILRSQAKIACSIATIILMALSSVLFAGEWCIAAAKSLALPPFQALEQDGQDIAIPSITDVMLASDRLDTEQRPTEFFRSALLLTADLAVLAPAATTEPRSIGQVPGILVAILLTARSPRGPPLA